MSCVLRVTGDFDPQHFLTDSPWQAEAIRQRGETLGRNRVALHSGFNVLVSEAGFDAPAEQMLEATAFLTQHEQEFARLKALPRATASLDFGVAQRELPAWSVRLPAKLIELAGRCGLDVELSFYAIREENEDTEQSADSIRRI